MKNEKAHRNLAIDIIRVVGLYLTISVHYLAGSKLDIDAIVIGKRMYVMVLIRTFAMICVPIFMGLSGFS